MGMNSRKGGLLTISSQRVCSAEIQNHQKTGNELQLKHFNVHRCTHVCGVSEDNALAVVVTDGFGCHGDRDERPVDF